VAEMSTAAWGNFWRYPGESCFPPSLPNRARLEGLPSKPRFGGDPVGLVQGLMWPSTLSHSIRLGWATPACARAGPSVAIHNSWSARDFHTSTTATVPSPPPPMCGAVLPVAGATERFSHVPRPLFEQPAVATHRALFVCREALRAIPSPTDR